MGAALSSNLVVTDHSWAQIIESHREKLVAYLTGMLHCHALAEDVLQETFIRLASMELSQYQSVQNQAAYCYQTARNIAIDTLRKRAREKSIDIDEAEPQYCYEQRPNIEDKIIENNLETQMLHAVQQLSSRHLTVLSLYTRGNYKQKEIAKICAISPTLVSFILQEVVLTCQAVLPH